VEKKYLPIAIFVVVLLLAFGYAFFLRTPFSVHTDTQGPLTATTSIDKAPQGGNVVHYFCAEGDLTAVFLDGKVNITWPDERTVDLLQVRSGSGIRYESGTLMFSGKGSDAFMEDNGKRIFDNCLAGTKELNNSVSIFTDQAKTFSIAFPSNLTVHGGEIGYTQEWSQGATSSGMILAVIDLPKTFQPQTNFAEAKLTVGASSDPAAVASCNLPESWYLTKGAQTVSINGTSFTKFKFGGAAAGNFYETTSFRSLRDSMCYAVEYTIHSTNIGNYPPELGIKKFDEQAVESLLNNIVQSYKFL
jgi:membrane-bound inhibitor of C-type lysozyme